MRVSSGFQTRKNLVLFLSVWKPDEAKSTSFWNDFSKETIQNYAVLFFHIFLQNGLYVWFVVFTQHLLYLWAFVFNYPTVLHCTKFVSQRCYELEVITYCFCHGRRKVLLARNNWGKRILPGEKYRKVPKSTRCKNKWAVGIFWGLTTSAKCKVSNSQSWWSFKECELDKGQPLTCP